MPSRGLDLRKGRVSEVGRIYPVTIVTHARRPGFADLRAERRPGCRSGGEAGPVWQAGSRDHALRGDEDVVANPARAGLLARIGDYPFRDAKWL